MVHSHGWHIGGVHTWVRRFCSYCARSSTVWAQTRAASMRGPSRKPLQTPCTPPRQSAIHMCVKRHAASSSRWRMPWPRRLTLISWPAFTAEQDAQGDPARQLINQWV